MFFLLFLAFALLGEVFLLSLLLRISVGSALKAGVLARVVNEQMTPNVMLICQGGY